MKRMICFLSVFVFLLVGCASDTAEHTSLPDYSDPIGSYDTESVLTPEGNKSEEPSDMVQGETTEDGFTVKFKKYDYQGNNLVIMHVENKTDKHYTLTVNGQYLNADGSVKQTESKTFEGFAAGFANYFIFDPHTVFDGFDYTIEFEPYAQDPASAYLSMNGVVLDFMKWKGHYGELAQTYVGVCSYFYMTHTYSERLHYGADFMVLDKNDEICFVDTQLMETNIPPLKDGQDSKTAYGTLRFMFYDENVLWEDVDDYVLPDELNGEITGIVAYKWIDYKSHY